MINLHGRIIFVDHVSLKIKRNLGIMKRVRNDIPKESLIALYGTMVEPYLRYCSNTWGKCGAMLICKFQTDCKIEPPGL